ncbi:MAG TPA: chromate transporter [Acetobacteraceae bacterium]|nr:chromate transporter [Acetobacteraceae bacterium]
MRQLAALAGIFAQLSLVAFGGGNSILPEMQRQVVQVHPWITAQDFAALYALAQAAPGPNMLVSALIGLRVAGVPGALVALGSLCAPSSALTFVCAGFWHRFHTRPWRIVVQRALAPVTAGLVMAGAALLVRTTGRSVGLDLLILVATALFLLTRIHPLLVLAAATALGASGLIG